MIGASRYRIVLALLSAVTAALFVLSLVTGPAGIGFSDALASLYSGGDQGAGVPVDGVEVGASVPKRTPVAAGRSRTGSGRPRWAR